MENHSVNDVEMYEESQSVELNHFEPTPTLLPYDVLLEIFAPLDRKTLSQMRLVNKLFKNASDETLKQKKWKGGHLFINQKNSTHEFHYKFGDFSNSKVFGKCYTYRIMKSKDLPYPYYPENEDTKVFFSDLVAAEIREPYEFSLQYQYGQESKDEGEYDFGNSPVPAAFFDHLTYFTDKFEVVQLTLKNVHVDDSLLRQVYECLKGGHRIYRIEFCYATAGDYTPEQLRTFGMFLQEKGTKSICFIESPKLLRLFLDDDFKEHCSKFENISSETPKRELQDGTVNYLRLGDRSSLLDYKTISVRELIVNKQELLKAIQARLATWKQVDSPLSWRLSTYSDITEEDARNSLESFVEHEMRYYDPCCHLFIMKTNPCAVLLKTARHESGNYHVIAHFTNMSNLPYSKTFYV